MLSAKKILSTRTYSKRFIKAYKQGINLLIQVNIQVCTNSHTLEREERGGGGRKQMSTDITL